MNYPTQHFRSLISQYSEVIEERLCFSDIAKKHGLHAFNYQTSSFADSLFNQVMLTDGATFYDLGSGYGNVLITGALKFPRARFKGIEIVFERHAVCREMIHTLRLKNVEAIGGDFLKIPIEDGDIFYLNNMMYEFQCIQLLKKLEEVAKSRMITVVVEYQYEAFDRTSWLYQYFAQEIDWIRKIKFYHS